MDVAVATADRLSVMIWTLTWVAYVGVYVVYAWARRSIPGTLGTGAGDGVTDHTNIQTT
jgi:hypothetical protein